MIKIIDENQFTDLIQNSNTVIQFSANWCGPCKALTNTLTNVIPANPTVHFAKIDIDNFPDLAARFGIRSIPSLIFFNSGKEVSRAMGAMQGSKVQEFIDRHLS